MPKTKGSEIASSRLGLGTAQFGLDYGVTNKFGKPTDVAIRRILTDALENGLGVIDTAPAYGNAEARLGELLSQDHGCRIVTKTPSRPNLTRFGTEDAEIVRDSFANSLRNLRCESVHGLLVHLGTDVLLPGGERLVETLIALRDRGLVRKVGVSIYGADELDGILQIFTPEIVQLPLSVADQRLLQSGHIAKLKALDVEVHIRSIFLQGVLLADPMSLPAFMAKYVPKLQKMRATPRDTLPLEVCLAFARQIPEVDFVLAGAATPAEWKKIQSAFTQLQNVDLDFSALAIDDPQFLNPSNWPKEAT